MSADLGSPDPAMDHPEIDGIGPAATSGPRKISRLLAQHQPVTQVVDAARSLMVGGTLQDTGAVWAALAWCVGALIIVVPLAVRKYRKVA